MNKKILSYFYKYEGQKKIFCKVQFIRLIRNKIIDPNTEHILSHGFYFYDKNEDVNVRVPCDDSNWNEYLTFKNGLELGVFQYPFTIKLYHDYFYNVENYENFLEIFNEIIKFRTDVIRHGWALKYGISYKDNDYPELETLSENELLSWQDPRDDAKFTLDSITEDDFDKK